VPAWRLAIAPHVAERIRHFAPDLKRGVREAIRAIAVDPARGEPLKRELQGYLKYRVRRFRIVYRVDRRARTVAILAVGPRRSIYEDVAAAIRQRSGA
jgi:mRNA interferase RelE/StbE